MIEKESNRSGCPSDGRMISTTLDWSGKGCISMNYGTMWACRLDTGIDGFVVYTDFGSHIEMERFVAAHCGKSRT